MNSDFFPVVSVDGVTIPRDAIIKEAQNHAAARNRPGDAWRAAARALIVKELLIRRGNELGLSPEPRVLDPGRRETEEEALCRAVMEYEVTPKAPTMAEAQAFFVSRPERFRAPDLYEASHILFEAETDDPASGRNAAARAVAAIETLRGRPAAFAALARRESDCPSRTAGGKLGQFQTGDMAPEIEHALDSLEPGEVSPSPVRSRFGWHVVRLDERAPGRVPPFDAIAPAVCEALEKVRWAVAARSYVETLVSDANIEGVSMHDAA